MKWSKLKNIILILLVVVNVCLIGIVAVREGREANNQRQTQERVVEVLKNSGKTFLPDKVPGALTLTPKTVVLVPRGEEEARGLVGEIESTESAGTRTTYVGERGRVSFSDNGAIDAALTAGAWTIGGADAGEDALAWLGRLGGQGTVVDQSAEGTDTRVVVRQDWDGACLPGCTLTFSYTDGALVSVKGRAIVGTATEKAAGSALLDGSTALLRFLAWLGDSEYVCGEIRDMRMGYAVSGTRNVTLTPAWYLWTDARPWVYSVDGSTGSVSSVE